MCDVCSSEAKYSPTAAIYKYEIIPIIGIHRYDAETIELDLCERCAIDLGGIDYQRMFLDTLSGMRGIPV